MSSAKKRKGEVTMSSAEEERKDITRREFIKGAAVGAAGVAGAGLLASPVEAQEVEVNPLIPQTWDYEADVVVVGLGGAGASAAIEAYDNGASVLVVEKQPYGEGELEGYAHFSNSRMCGGVFHSPHPDGDREAMVEYVKAMFSGENCPWKLEGEQPHVSEEMARMYVEGIYQLPGWLLSIDPDLDEEGMAPSGDASFPMFPEFAEAKYGATRYIRYKDLGLAEDRDRFAPKPKTHKGSGEAWMWALLQEGIIKQRPEITLLYSTPAKRLVQDPDTKQMLGVIAETEEGEIACKAKKAVILTSGGFEYSLPMRRAFLKGPGVKGWGFYGSPDNRGEGIAMAIQVGAAQAKVAKSASRIEPAIPAGRAWDETGLKQGLSSKGRYPHSIIVDNYGKRYIDEWLVYDSSRPYRYQSYEEIVKYKLLAMAYDRIPSWHISDETFRQERGRLVSGRFVETNNPRLAIPWAEDNSDAIEKGWVLTADTLEELAAAIKADPENRGMMDADTLAETVATFNSYVAAGEDLDFGRDPDMMGAVETPPFYAVRYYAGGPNTKGGIDADAQRRVLDWEGNPIPRFYTAGEISSVFKFTYQAGGNVTECMVCGREAGKNAAALTAWDEV